MWVNVMKYDFEQIGLNIRKKIYRYIGSGSGRYVFDLGDGFVVKAAKNRKGLAQNKAEYQIASIDDSHIFAKILQVSEDYQLLIMEKAEKVENISEVWNYFNVKSNNGFYQLKELKDISAKHHLILKDLSRPVNWGTINGRPVIIDYGFTRKVKKKYYSLF